MKYELFLSFSKSKNISLRLVSKICKSKIPTHLRFTSVLPPLYISKQGVDDIGQPAILLIRKNFTAGSWIRPCSPLVGGIENDEGAANSLKIESLARFAVEEHNKKKNALLEFKKLVCASQQVVAGIIYYVTIEVTDGGHNKVYEAKIWEKAWQNFKEVQEFKLIGDAPAETSA